MDTANEEEIYEDLDTLHSTVVDNISRDITKPNIQWEQLPDNITAIQKCRDNTLIDFTTPLVPQYFNIIIFRIEVDRAELTLHQTGHLIPLSQCPGCSIYDEERQKSHQLVFGKKMRLSRRGLKIHVNGKCVLYLLWLFTTKADFDRPQSKPSSVGHKSRD
ncbi:hypothetical protein GGI42DRAFT_245476 [Trichoderma sp. SZMC 28013]